MRLTSVRRGALACIAALALAACAKPAADSPSTAAPAATPPAKTAAAAPQPVSFDPRLVEMATSAAKTAITEGQAAATAVKAGTDYVEIKDGKPFQPLDGKVEVTEFFSYRCPHCNDFEPLLEAWTVQQPANVRVTPIALGAMDDPLARVYFAALNMGQLPLTHARLFRAIHAEQALKPGASGNDIAEYLGQQGFDAGSYRNAMGSDKVTQQMKAALEFAQRSGIEGTPAVVVNGKYLVKGKDPLDVLRIASALVARESGKP